LRSVLRKKDPLKARIGRHLSVFRYILSVAGGVFDAFEAACRFAGSRFGEAEMVLEIVGIVIVISHVILIGTIILWFGLGNPTSAKQFRVRFKAQFLGGGRRDK
jgi:hypothetical protein